MKILIAVSTAVLLLVAMSVHAENTQQDRMKQCNADAKTKGLAGTDRKTFMSTCLKG